MPVSTSVLVTGCYTRPVGTRRLRVVSFVLVAALGGIPAAEAVCGVSCGMASSRAKSFEVREGHGQHHAAPHADAVALTAGEHRHHTQSLTTADGTSTNGSQSVVLKSHCCRSVSDIALRAILKGRSDEVVSIHHSSPALLASSDRLDAPSGLAECGRDTCPPGFSPTRHVSSVLRV
jgi:hypothetical protein